MMKRSRTTPLLLSVAALTTACGCFASGTWEDDPGNWARAFGSTRPPDVVVVHSKYWRSPHWSYEFQYFFEIAPNAALKGRLLAANGLQRASGNDAEQARARNSIDSPPWFAPKRTTDYEIWVFGNEPDRHFMVLIDTVSGQMFISDYLL